MTMQAKDWQSLRTPLMLLGAAILLGSGLAYYLYDLSNKSEIELQNQQNLLSAARSKYQSADAEKQTIIKYLPEYQTLIKNGFIGEEQRIEWIDTLRNIHQQNKMFSIDYNIEKQDFYTPNFALNLGALKLRKSSMELKLNMLHEGDIITLLDALQAEQNTPFLTRQCTITQTAEIDGKLTPHLLADCTLDWLTLKEPNGKGAGT
jgi:hypothetical protein